MSRNNKKILNSKALKDNLEQTRNIDIVIPENHLWLLTQSKNYWGIHKRTEEFFREFHHPYSNRKIVIELLNKILISDFWIYLESENLEKIFTLFFEMFHDLLQEELSNDLLKQLVFIYLNFFCKYFDKLENSSFLILDFIKLLDKNLSKRYFSYLSNIGYFIKCLKPAATQSRGNELVFNFMQKLAQKNIDFWHSTSNIETWYLEHEDRFVHDYQQEIKELGNIFFNDYQKQLDNATNWNELCESVFTFSDIIDAFRDKIDTFQEVTERFCYIFYLLHLPGMIYHRNYLLIDLNRTIKSISRELNEEKSIQSIDELFSLFTDFKDRHMSLILDSILTLGKEIINTKNEKLIHYYEDQVIKFGFVSGDVTYVSNNWTLRVNPNHVKNIRIWLEIIEYDPEMMQKLLSALIINLYVGGIFIFDTDLFQKDVTLLLNTHISPIYKRIKQLTRIFPVYFNEIGAEGVLREVTTQIDELSQRNDKLIHFLRKQTHTEGNNSHIQITYKIIQFWHDLDLERLIGVIPQGVVDTIDINGIWIQGVHKVINELCVSSKLELKDLMLQDIESIKKQLSTIQHDNQIDIKRVGLIIEIYQLLKEKYSFETNDITAILRRFNFINKKSIDHLESCLNKQEDIKSLVAIYAIISDLNKIIFDPAVSKGWENIYYKRHIAYGIPSMYGKYSEKKFEALGLTFHLEHIASAVVSRIISHINIEYFTVRTLKNIYLVIHLLREGLALGGIYDQEFDSNLEMFQYSLTTGGFTIHQYINIFKYMESNIKEIINKFFILPYNKLLKTVIPQHLEITEQISEDQRRLIIMQKSEVFYRTLLSSAFLVQTFDNFIGKILNNLRNMVSHLSNEEIHIIMNYDPDKIVSLLYSKTPTMDSQIFLGSKAFFLKKLYLWNYPVPPGFVLTTEVFKVLDLTFKISSLSKEVEYQIIQHIAKLERKTKLKFGDPEKPLLLSVRSGSTISMPGIMNTFLNVGMNDDITEKLSKQENFAWSSWDCYRRLIQSWGMAYGLDRDDFDQIMLNYKKKYNVSKKIDFKPEIMREIAYSYKKLLLDNNIKFASDPLTQLKKAIISVFHSWNTPRAKNYRDHMHIADEWGTAVIVQKMVFGNIHQDSGSGVLFTHNVQDNISGINLVGDFSFLSQGEDIVAGLVNPMPVSERQRLKYYQNAPISLETAFPKIYKKLVDISQEITETHGFGYQEIEFTFETSEPDDLYILQTRDMKLIDREEKEVFAVSSQEMKRVSSGIGIGNKVLNGTVVFDLEDLKILRKEHPDQKAVLVRPDTVPDDINIIFECEGLLTGRGGATSHAAVTAANLGKICIVNCDKMTVQEKEKKCIINENIFKAFDLIAIDGYNGIVYKGNYPVTIQES